MDRGNIRKQGELDSGSHGRVLDTPMLAHFLSLIGHLLGAGLKCAPHLSGCISVGFFAAALSNRKQIVSGITRVNGDGAVE